MKIGSLGSDKTERYLICYTWFIVNNKVDEVILSRGIRTRSRDSEHDSVQLASVIRSFARLARLARQMYAQSSAARRRRNIEVCSLVKYLLRPSWRRAGRERNRNRETENEYFIIPPRAISSEITKGPRAP